MDKIDTIQKTIKIPELPEIPYSKINPNTTLYICRGVPLPANYSDTITFATTAAQLNFFSTKVKYKVENMTPISLNMAVAVPYVADDLYDCNYIVFQNSNFDSKYLFAFITRIEYVNVSVSRIFFELDVIQSFYFNMIVNPCLVEREHVNNDSIGENTLGESVPLGEYVRLSRIRCNISRNKAVQVTLPADIEQSGYNNLTGGIFSGLRQAIIPVENNQAPGLQDLLQNYINTGKEGDIISIQMVPGDYVTKRGDKTPVSKTFTIAKGVLQLDGYTPKNKKLLQYPYAYIEVDNTQGQIQIYKFEYFSTSDCEFKVIGMTNGGTPELVLYPVNYDNVANNVMEHMTLSGFPQCAWAGDAYKAYLANNSMKNAFNIGAGIIGTGLALSTGNVGAAVPAVAGMSESLTNGQLQQNVSAITGLTSTLTNYMQEDNNAQIESNKVRGTQGSDALYAQGLMDFWITIRTIDRSHAIAIDDYLTRFGYRVDRIKVPNITGRKSWNYVKTVNCNVGGMIPFTDRMKINQIFNNGITFWHGDYVGDYGRDNAII